MLKQSKVIDIHQLQLILQSIIGAYNMQEAQLVLQFYSVTIDEIVLESANQSILTGATLRAGRDIVQVIDPFIS